MIGMGATHYASVDFVGLGAQRTIPGQTQFSTTWGAGVKAYPSQHFGVRFGAQWTPTYIKTDAEGWWCDLYWGCYLTGDPQVLEPVPDLWRCDREILRRPMGSMRTMPRRSPWLVWTLAAGLALAPGTDCGRADNTCDGRGKTCDGRGSSARHERRYRLAAQRHAEERHGRVVPAAGRELDRSEADRRLVGRVVHADRRQGAGARHDQDRRADAASPSTTASCGMDLKITEYNFKSLSPDQVKALVADVQALPQQRARPRPRSAARLRRRQPAAGEERRGHQGRPAEGVLRARRRRC